MTTIRRIITHRPDLGPKTLPMVDLGPPAAVVTPPPFPADGPTLWGELHRLALVHGIRTAAERAEVAAYLGGKFVGKLPCGPCQSHWLGMLEATPPDFRSPAKFFAWTVDRHNEVNLRLGKPTVSVGAAHRTWFFRKGQKRAKNA